LDGGPGRLPVGIEKGTLEGIVLRFQGAAVDRHHAHRLLIGHLGTTRFDV
jgi:hypothetical protein